jgi:hypothetical protein
MKIDFNRVITIDFLINQKRTGPPDEFARYLNISRRTLFESLSFMKNVLNAPIVYNKVKRSYVYNEIGIFCFVFQKDKEGAIKRALMQAVKGAGILFFAFSSEAFSFIRVLTLELYF